MKIENQTYSSTPLIKKLGMKDGDIIQLVNSPDNYIELLGPLPFIVVWTKERKLQKT